MKIAVITDSSAGISKEEALENGILVARMPLTINGKEYMEEEGISREHLIRSMREGATVGTAQPPMGQLIQLFEKTLETYDHIIFLPISSKLSGTYLTACGIARDYENRITVIDSQFVSAPLYLLSLEVKKMAEHGLEPDAIKEIVERDSFMYAPLIPEDIQYLKRGGRIKPAAAAIANLLKIVPVLKVADGEIDLAEKVRTFKKAVKVGVDLAISDRNPEDYTWIVLSGDCDEKIYSHVIKEVEKRTGETVVQRNLYPIVLAHTGPGSISICAFKKIKYE
ncbi:DegV family protein [Erysipelothrix inopinata]|nr:DegV family protein [Erysipelothrix inopinata]